MRRPHLPAHLQPVGQRIHGDDLLGPQIAQHGIEEQSHGTLADHHHLLVDDIAQLVEAVDDRAQQLAHQHHLDRLVLRQPDTAFERSQHLFLIQTAIRAPQQHSFSFRIFPRGTRFDDPQPLVTGSARRKRIIGDDSAVLRLVRATDRHALHAHQHLLGARLRFFQFHDLPLPGSDQPGCFHFRFLLADRVAEDYICIRRPAWSAVKNGDFTGSSQIGDDNRLLQLR